MNAFIYTCILVIYQNLFWLLKLALLKCVNEFYYLHQSLHMNCICPVFVMARSTSKSQESMAQNNEQIDRHLKNLFYFLFCRLVVFSRRKVAIYCFVILSSVVSLPWNHEKTTNWKWHKSGPIQVSADIDWS